jgi:hypothetical protein
MIGVLTVNRSLICLSLALLTPAAAHAQDRSKSAPSPLDSFGKASLKTVGEARWLGYAEQIAKRFQFSESQIEQTRQLARKNGMPSCIYGTNSYSGPGAPPEMSLTGPITTCHRYNHAFLEEVLALVTPEQKTAQKSSFEAFSHEISHQRLLIEQQSKHK